ncbi:MAG: hypothetical protein K8T91_18905 [Planctomycetes bacterium]|nr:hypothetical protein [Planctomycetota bacterium]
MIRRMLIFGAFCLLLWPAYGSAAETAKTFTLPALVCTSDGKTGSVKPVQFGFTRNVATSPLTVAIEEDSPAGAGEGLRASIWQAAMVAALARNDDLGGVKITVSLPGEVDGPSAGGLIALAILSALDGRDLPTDFAFTGTIMPDGTIGRVGGVPAKIRAAAAANAKRVLLPAFVRFERDHAKVAEANLFGDEPEVDLKDLAKSLQMEFIQVENLEQAYAAVHRLPAKPTLRPGRDVLDIPDAMETVLKKEYRRAITAGDKLWDAIPKEEREQIEQEAASRQLILSSRSKADSAMRSGKFLVAAYCARQWEMILQARDRNVKEMNALVARKPADPIAELDKIIAAQLKAVPTPAAVLADATSGLPILGSQFTCDLPETMGIVGLVDWMERRSASQVEQIQASELKVDEKEQAVFNARLNAKALELLIAHVAGTMTSRYVTDASKLCEGLPQPGLTVDPAIVERLFYSSLMATHNAFEAQTVHTAAAELQVRGDEVLNRMTMYDTDLAMYLPAKRAVASLHTSLAINSKRKPDLFIVSAAAQQHAICLATASSISVRWGELDLQITEEGELNYQRTDLLNYLITVARENAVTNIAECRRRGVPCIQPIYFVQDGDLSRDDPAIDKVSVLASYWRASLQAQALMLMFGKRA